MKLLASQLRSPTTTFTRIGKNEIIAAMITFDDAPYPNQITMRGAIAILGMDWSAIRYGYSVRSSSQNWVTSEPTMTPATAAIQNPPAASPTVTRKCVR